MGRLLSKCEIWSKVFHSSCEYFESADNESMSTFAGKTILVVDDEPDLREILKDEFLLEGAKVFEAENGRKALEIIKSEKINIVVSDIRMPGGDGVTLAREIKKLSGERPILYLITGFADITPDEAYDIGVEGFVTKPFNLEFIRNEILRSTFDRKTRWSKEVSSEKIKELKLNDNFNQMIQSQKLKIGRGGLYIQGEYPYYRNGDILRLVFSDQSFVIGCVRWVRIEKSENLSSGMGLEFLSISSDILLFVDSFIQEHQPTCFLPRT